MSTVTIRERSDEKKGFVSVNNVSKTVERKEIVYLISFLGMLRDVDQVEFLVYYISKKE